MAEPKKPNFMKMSISKEAGPADPFTPEQIAAAERAAKAGGVLGAKQPPEPAPTAKPPEALLQPPALLARADEAAAYIRAQLGEAKIAVVLGSGLGGFADALEEARFAEYGEIPHFPRSTVVGHRGRLGCGRAGGVPLYVFQGRFHYYEGYALDEVTFYVRVLARLGVRLLVVTNAAGGIGAHLAPGDLMVIDDHLNLMGVNPLRGAHDDRYGARFPDMTEIYTPRYKLALYAAAEAEKITTLKSGVYAALSGPSYETPAEIRMLERLGADAIGMSTVPEAIVARQMGLGVCGISGIANMAAGKVRGHVLTHAEVVETMNAIGGTFTRLLKNAVPRLAAAVDAAK